MVPQKCGCPCGYVEFDVVSEPLVRVCCHCTICQEFNDAAYADILIYDGNSMDEPAKGRVDYKSYKPRSPILRGRCSNCDHPVLEKFVMGPKLWIVPVSSHDEEANLPNSAAHIFYETRVTNLEESSPKYRGAFKSYFILGKHIIFAKLFNN